MRDQFELQNYSKIITANKENSYRLEKIINPFPFFFVIDRIQDPA